MEGSFEQTRSIECSICAKEFRDLRLLPCGHTLCTPCLQRLIGRVGLLLNYVSSYQRLRCPLCKRNLVVPAGRTQAFPMQRNVTTSEGSNQAQVNEYPGVSNCSIWVMIAILVFFSYVKDIDLGLIEMKASSSLQLTRDPVTISDSSGYLTMGLIRNKMFVINPVTSHGEIFDRTTFFYKSLWNVSDFYAIAGNTFCSKSKYLYVSTMRKAILKFDSEGYIVAKWSTGNVRGRPLVMADCNVAFIPHDSAAKIFIFTPYGDLIHVVQLKLNVSGSRLNCAVHLQSGDFLVSYGSNSDTLHGLSLVNVEGKVLRSFGETKGNGTNRVNGVYDLFVEEIGDIQVVDHNNHRIVRLNSNLEYISETLISQNGQFVRFPYGALFDELHSRLFAMGSTWDETKSVLSPGKIIVYYVE